MGLHHRAGPLCNQLLQADAVNYIDRVEYVAFGFRHLLAFGITYKAVNIDFMKGYIAHELQAHHDHACHPEEDDVETGDQHVGRVKGFQFGCFMRPAECGKRPQRRGEPGVENILVLG